LIEPSRLCTVIPVRSPGRGAELVRTAETGCVELRLDYLGSNNPEAIAEVGLRLAEEAEGRGLSVIATIRSRSEGGRFQGSPEVAVKALSLLEASGVTVDYEALKPWAPDACRGCVASAHLGKPREEAALALIRKARGMGASAAKVVFVGGGLRGAALAARLVASWSGWVTSFTSGEYGVCSRLIALELGAPFIFVSHRLDPLEGVPLPEDILGGEPGA